MSEVQDEDRILPVGVKWEFANDRFFIMGGCPPVGMMRLNTDMQAYVVGVDMARNFIPKPRIPVVCKDCGHHAPPKDGGCENCWSENVEEDARVKNQEAQGEAGKRKNYGLVRASK